MYKVWKISSAIALVQLISVGVLSYFTIFPFASIIIGITFSTAVVMLILYALTFMKRSEASKINLKRIVYSLAIAGLAFNIIGIYLNYQSFELVRLNIFAVIIIAIVTFGVIALNIWTIVEDEKKDDENLNVLLTVLCALPLGIGMILGGIVGKRTKKF